MEINIDSFEFNHSTELQIRFNDVDIAGHVNNAVYQYYYDYGKLRFFESKYKNIIDWNKKGFVLLNINIDFIAPTFLHDNIVVETRINEINNKSLIIQQIIREKGSKNENGVRSIAKSVMVAFDFIKQESISIPNKWKNI